MADDPFQLQRFVQAQAPVMAYVEAELAAGAKTSHWMWFVFPQLKALGRSATAVHYGLASADEAGAYWAHPLLGPRLKRCTERVLAVRGKTLHQVFGSPDDMKFRSCMTLFETVAGGEPAFTQAIERCCEGERDGRTLALLGRA